MASSATPTREETGEPIFSHLTHDSSTVETTTVERSEGEEGRSLTRVGAVASQNLASSVDAAAKRTLDVTLALIQSLLALPGWILIPLAIKIEDGGPVFYGQKRMGYGGELFTSWKFRSMKPDQEDDDPRFNRAAFNQAELERNRITKVGAFLRATALDELPQLWNIIRGDMSYVGPRALLPEECEARNGGETVRLRDLPGCDERHSVRPGLTGIAQICGPRDLPHRQKFRYDLLYVRNRTVWLDLKLIFRSIWISLRGGWPHVGR